MTTAYVLVPLGNQPVASLPLSQTDLFPVVQAGGAMNKVTLAQFQASLASTGGLPFAAIWNSTTGYFSASLPSSPVGLPSGSFYYTNGGVICVVGTPTVISPPFYINGGVLETRTAVPGLPTQSSSTGLPTGTIYVNGGVVCQA